VQKTVGVARLSTLSTWLLPEPEYGSPQGYDSPITSEKGKGPERQNK